MHSCIPRALPTAGHGVRYECSLSSGSGLVVGDAERKCGVVCTVCIRALEHRGLATQMCGWEGRRDFRCLQRPAVRESAEHWRKSGRVLWSKVRSWEVGRRMVGNSGSWGRRKALSYWVLTVSQLGLNPECKDSDMQTLPTSRATVQVQTGGEGEVKGT